MRRGNSRGYKVFCKSNPKEIKITATSYAHWSGIWKMSCAVIWHRQEKIPHRSDWKFNQFGCQNARRCQDRPGSSWRKRIQDVKKSNELEKSNKQKKMEI